MMTMTAQRQPDVVLASDIDNTLTGDRAALEDLAARLETLRQRGELFLILSTGRRLALVLDGIAHEALPHADAIISQVGTEIYLPPFRPEMAPLPEWEVHLQRTFARERAVAFLEGVEGLEMQPDHYNTPLKVSAFLHKAPDPNAAAATVSQRIAAARVDDAYQVVWSSGTHLDIIPAAAGKGKAIRFLLDFLDLVPDQVVVAGDSGNDRSMFDAFPGGIVVANAQPELMQMRVETDAGHYFACTPSAAGVAEGLRHFDIL
jgi:sucrose-6F-phosphate phosphohydrolase